MIGWVFLLPLVLVTVRVRWRDALWAVGVADLPLGVYFGWQLLMMPDVFLFDLGYTLSRTGGGPLTDQLELLNQNLLTLLHNAWWLLGILGLFLIDNTHLRYAILLCFLPLMIVGRTVPLFSLSAYYLLPFLPLIAIGFGVFILRAWAYCEVQFDNRIVLWSMRALLILPLITLTWGTIQAVSNEYRTEIDAFFGGW